MDSRKNEMQPLPPPPGILGSLRAGFDVVATHIAAILLPAALDLFLWLGPHLRVDQLLDRTIKGWIADLPGWGMPAAQVQQYQAEYTPDVLAKLQSFNVFAALRTYPVGVASLMAGGRPVNSPLGLPAGIQVNSFSALFLWLAALTVAGWLCGGLYFRWVAALVAREELAGGGRAVLQTLLYSMIWSLLIWIVGTPVFIVLSLLYTLNPLIGQGALLFLGFLSTWLIVPIFFSPHGIFLRGQNAFVSILGSLQMSRLTLPSSSLFVLAVFLIGWGLNYLWGVPPNDSWLTLVGILGHAFIVTALLAASFVYYHDTTLWIQTVRERLRASAPTPQA